MAVSCASNLAFVSANEGLAARFSYLHHARAHQTLRALFNPLGAPHQLEQCTVNGPPNIPLQYTTIMIEECTWKCTARVLEVVHIVVRGVLAVVIELLPRRGGEVRPRAWVSNSFS